jgi:hypothetical protein
MRIDRSHRPWAIGVGLVTLVCAALYLGSQSATGRIPLLGIPVPGWLLDTVSPRNTIGAKPLGLIFGTVAFLIFLFASALGVRKKKRLWRIGNVQSWLRAHIWLTILTVPLVLFHCGFKLGGMHTSILFWLWAIVMVSGFWGIAMQHFFPAIMKDRLTREWVYEQIPNVREANFEAVLDYKKGLEARRKSEGGGAGGTAVAADPAIGVMLDFLSDEVLPFLSSRSARRTRLADARNAEDVIRLVRLNVSESFRPKVDEIKQWCTDHRDMAQQERLHHWLHGWLIIHVPVSFILLVWTIWHIFITFSYLH